MATGRTVNKFIRVYGNGYDLSGYARSIGPLAWVYDEAEYTCLSDEVKGALPNKASISAGTLNGVFDTTATTGLHIVAVTPTVWDLMVPIGIRAIPAMGDPVFMGKFLQKEYLVSEGGGAVNATLSFNAWDLSDLPAYANPWGKLAKANLAVTAVNSAVGYDDLGAAGSTTGGGYMMYQVFAASGGTAHSANIKIQHAATNSDGSFSDLGGCATGVIVCSTPSAGIVNTTATTTEVLRYIRWQIVLTDVTSVTFALAFCRGK